MSALKFWKSFSTSDFEGLEEKFKEARSIEDEPPRIRQLSQLIYDNFYDNFSSELKRNYYGRWLIIIHTLKGHKPFGVAKCGV